MSTPVIKLGGQILGGATTYGWDMTFGVKPAEQSYTLTTARVEALALCTPLTLEIEGVRKPLKVEHVYALDVGAAGNPRQRVVRIADRRWLWSRKWVSSSFNVRRVSGDSSLLSEAGQPVELAQIEPTIRYAKWSLDPPENGAIKWTARRVLEFVFGQIDQPAKIADDLPEVEIQDLVLEDDGASAVERVLGYLPGADVYMDLDGTAIVVNTQKPPPADGPPVTARKQVALGGDAVITVRKSLRPSKIVVLFSPEVEVRFDSVAEGGTRTPDTPTLVNAAASPDLTLALSSGVTVARGTYVPLAALFTSWGSVFGQDAEALSFAKLAEFGTACSLLEQIFSRGGAGIYSPVNGARVRAAIDCWRGLYQIDEQFVQRISSIRATRVAIVSQATGTRARSEAYCDFLRRPNKKNPEANGKIEGAEYGWYARGYSTLLADARAAPATVSVVSETAGVIRITPQLDPWGLSDAIILGYPVGDLATRNTGDAEANRTGVEAFAQWAQMRLADDFRVATVLTVAPASPNNLDRFHKVEIEASAVGVEATGPPIYARVFESVMTARFAWSDEQGDALTASILTGAPRPITQMVNRKDVDDAAQATARSIYAGMIDTPDTRSGPVSVDMDPALKPLGSVGSVRHGLNGGFTTTRVMATGIRRPVNLLPFLDASTRATIFRLAKEVES